MKIHEVLALNTDTIFDRFWSKVEVLDNESCWEWTPSSINRAHGSLRARNISPFTNKECSSIMAHRLSYLIHYGEIPDGLVIRHTCDNPPCVNPYHLITGTIEDNIRDRLLWDSFHGAAISTFEVPVIRKRLAEGELPSDIALDYETQPQTIRRIMRGENSAAKNDGLQETIDRMKYLRMNKRQDVEERFWDKVDICGEDECWDWTASRSTEGYGWFGFGETIKQAHRVRMILDGHDVEGMYVNHHCDNPPCVNPKHLYVGTSLDNTRDKQRRGRTPDRSGSKNGRAVLKEDDVAQIKILLRDTDLTQKELASMFGVGQAQISNIKREITWKHVEI